MRIVNLVQGYHPAIGGTEFLIQKVSEYLVAEHKDSVTVITPNALSCNAFIRSDSRRLPVGVQVINGVQVYRVPFTTWHVIILRLLQAVAWRLSLPYNDILRTICQGPVSPRMFYRAMTCSADLIVASSFPLLHMWYALWAGRIRQCPVVLIGGLHPEDRWGYDRPCILSAIKRCDAYVAYTAYERDFVMGKDVPPHKVSVIGPGVDLEPFLVADGQSIRQRYGWKDNPVIAFVGQHGEHKGLDTLLSAMLLVWEKKPEARLLIAGARGNFTSKLKDLIARLTPDLQTRVVLLMDFPEAEKPQIFAACDIFALPSRSESFGIVFLEAWAAGKPVIGCGTGATPRVIADRQDGVLITCGTESELAKAILELANDAGLRRRLGENGRAKVRERFTWKQVSQEFRYLYAQVVAKGAARRQGAASPWE